MPPQSRPGSPRISSPRPSTIRWPAPCSARRAAEARDRGHRPPRARRPRPHSEPRGDRGDRQSPRPRASRAPGRRAPGAAVPRAPRGGGVPRPLHARGGRRLRGGTQSRAAHGRHRALRLRSRHGGLREAPERHRVRAGRASRSGPASGCPRPRRRARRPRHGGGDAHRRDGGDVMTAAASGGGRHGRVERKTKETQIALHLGLDGTGASKVVTGIPFFDHMLEAWSKHGLMDLTVEAHGDLEVDLHHTVEDVGICLGKAFREALGDRAGIVRYGASFLPMDEALLHAAVDISGRPYLVFNVPLRRTRVSNFDLDLLEDFFRAFAFNAEVTLHVNMHYGQNLHHIAEATFKAVGRALAEATRLNPRIAGVLSTKGTL